MNRSSDYTKCENSSITASCTVNGVLAKMPAAAGVFDRFGIDTCCGGSASIADAAVQARVDPSLLIAALDRAQRADVPETARSLPQASSCSCGCG